MFEQTLFNLLVVPVHCSSLVRTVQKTVQKTVLRSRATILSV
jgi:hypothetical protein